jgi:hypothetical protein
MIFHVNGRKKIGKKPALLFEMPVFCVFKGVLYRINIIV